MTTTPAAQEPPAAGPESAEPSGDLTGTYVQFVGEQRVIRRTIEGPSGELVETDVERVPAEYVEGVPARSLSRQEYDALTPEEQHLVQTCGLYARVDPGPVVTPAAPQEG